MAPASPYANGRFSPLPLYDGERVIQSDPPFDTLTETFTARACEFIRQHRAGPFFLYVPHPMPHTPLAASPAFLGSTGRGLYADVMAELDASVGRLLDTLEDCKLSARTLVILASDNGPWLQMGRHSGRAVPLREGKGTTFEGGIRVPFVLRWPGTVPAGSRTKVPFAAIDLLPTLAEVAGVGLAEDSVDGRSALKLWQGRTTDSPCESYAFYYDGPKLQSLRSGPWKYHLAHRYRTMDGGKLPTEDGIPGSYAYSDLSESLMNLEVEIAEQSNVQADEPQVLEKFRALARRELERDALSARVPDHPWAGPAWMPCRLQDWRRRGEHLHCEASDAPFRTLQRLRERVLPALGKEQTLRVEVELGMDEVDWREDACAGFIMGCGRPEDDPRIGEMVQQAPGKDGGMLAVLAADGSLRLLDFSSPRKAGKAWSLPTDTQLGDLPLLAWSSARPRDGSAGSLNPRGLRQCRLVLEARTVASGHVRTRLSLWQGDKELVSTPDVDVAASFLDGGLGLMAHHLPKTVTFSRFSASGKDMLHIDAQREFGPCFGTQYSVSTNANGVAQLRLSAQMAPLPTKDYGTFGLDLASMDKDDWRAVGEGEYDVDSGTVVFPATPVPEQMALRWRVRGTWLAATNTWHDFMSTGIVRAAPEDDQGANVLLLSCIKGLTVSGAWNSSGVWYPHAEAVQNMLAHDPALVVFAGDQYYESDFSAADRGPNALLDAGTRWMRFHRAFGALLRDRPSIMTPDDHDVYHGNLMGAGGRAAEKRSFGEPPRKLSAQDSGGYTMPVRFVNAVHRMQCGHMPPSVVTPKLPSGITTFSTRMTFGPFDCAVLSDRMWKDSASVMLPAARVVNGFPEEKGAEFACPEASLLGTEQERFLELWAADKRAAAPVRLLVSQSPFVCAQTLPPGKIDSFLGMAQPPALGDWPPDDVVTQDCDSNGWPLEARARAVALMQAAGAIHLTGDQHLGVTLRYGINAFGDGPFAISSPALGNAWYRRWMPAPAPADIEHWHLGGVGEFKDGFGNPFHMLAVANPVRRGEVHDPLADYAPGYAIVRSAANTRAVSLELWPRASNPRRGGKPFQGWPVEVK
jgi:hypothetical protein